MSDTDDFASSQSSDGSSIICTSDEDESKKKTGKNKNNPSSAKKSSPAPPAKKTAPPTVKRPSSSTAQPTESKSAKTIEKTTPGASVSGNAQNPPTAPASSSSNVDITRGPPITTDIAAKKLILQYLRQQNRPYSPIQVHDNLHKRIPKATCERVLTALSSDGGGVICKEYGKAKIYFIDQSTLNSTCSQEDLDELQTDNENRKKQADESKALEKLRQNELHGCTNEPTDTDLERILVETETRLAEKSHRLGLISTNAVSMDPHALEHAIKGHNYYRALWLTRKQMCMGVVDMISEGMNKKVKDVMNEMCLETDQDAGVALPTLLKEPVRK